MKIYHVVDRLDPGGVSTVICDLAAYQRSSDLDVEVLQIRGSGMWTERLERLGVKTTRGGLESAVAIATCPTGSIFHCHQRSAAVLCLLLRKRPRTVEHVHNLILGSNFLSYRSRAVVAVSSHIERSLHQNFPWTAGKTVVLHNSSSSIADPVPDMPRTDQILAVGRLTEQKDPFYFLQIVEQLHRVRPEMTARWIGDGELRSQFLARVDALGLQQVISWQANASRTDVLRQMSTSLALLLPSAWEGHPLVALEALSCGTPVISTPLGDISALITELNAGMVVPSADPVAASQAILGNWNFLTTTDRTRIRDGLNSRHSFAAWNESWLAVYATVLDR